ncbi:MAG: D-alanyl-D-alanine carboxypeptidase [Oscillospiraceae bacterium]|nr:D-alanyl-D-alanine carboxypeptidase [Oscillospiraceae bacterium]MDD4413574.1 D-alanyl-D-alanine carboxypeptidase [Oscillospiraceae bacterium]
MKQWKKIMAALLSAAVMAMAGGLSAFAQQAGSVIIDIESGETAKQLMSDSLPAWISSDPIIPTDTSSLNVGGKSAVLIELSSGQVLFEKNSHERLPIASVNKVMTLLLIMEALDSGIIGLDDTVACSAHAASMGGSQIWLEPGEIMSVNDLIKAIAVVSANDACAMMAEYINGSEEGFVRSMNERAAALGMKDTQFKDCSGLDDEAYSSAYDVALMSRELMKHKKITKYTTIWMDTLRKGQSQLVNTNKLVRFYPGANGLKTGTTGKAGHNLSATAERSGMGLAAVILGCKTTDERFGGARKMLDYGFANYAVYTPKVEVGALTPVKVLRGVDVKVESVMNDLKPLLIKKGQEKSITQNLTLAEDLEAPVYDRQVIGELTLMIEGNVAAKYEVYAACGVPRLGLIQAFKRIFRALIA